MINKLKSKIKTALRTILVVKNWLTFSLQFILFKKSAQVIFRNGYKLFIKQGEWNRFNSFASFFRHFPDGKISGTIARLNYQTKKIKFDFGQWSPGAVSEFFGRNFPYKLRFDISELKNRTVIDIGAYLGDSTVWFGINEAKKVYAFEPLSSYYELCKNNIKLNNLSEICKIEQAAIGGTAKNDFFEVESKNKIIGCGEGLYDEYKKDIPIYTLEDIVKRYRIEKGAFLKIDCEGYEYEILLNCPDNVLALFKNIMMEYHYGYERLKNKLEKAGFNVRYTEPEYGYQANSGENFKKTAVGYIFASRED